MKKLLSVFLSAVMLLSCVMGISMNAYADSLSDARIASFDTLYTGTLSQTNEDDYYKFTMPSSGKVDFDIKAYTESTIYCQLYDSNYNEVDYFGIYYDDNLGYAWKQFSAYFSKGVFYIQLFTSYDGGKYDMIGSFTSADETFTETVNSNDNVAGKAHAISTDVQYFGQLGYSDDVDFFKLTLSEGDSVVFTGNMYSNGTFYVDVLNSKYESVDYFGIYEDSNLGYGTVSHSLTLSEGTYYFKVFTNNCSGFYDFIINSSDSGETIVDPEDIGWITDDDGKRYWDGYDYYYGWHKIDGKQYYFDPDTGYMVTGWLKINGKTFYFNSNGVIHVGWKKIGGKKYYFNKKGRMVTGWQKIGGKKYYFNYLGRMVTGWLKKDGKTYYLNYRGRMVTGWQKIGGKKYYFNYLGRMVTGWLKKDGKTYYFNYLGRMVTGWQTIDDNVYYFNYRGRMVTGWQKIDGEWYYFDDYGVCTDM